MTQLLKFIQKVIVVHETSTCGSGGGGVHPKIEGSGGRFTTCAVSGHVHQIFPLLSSPWLPSDQRQTGLHGNNWQ